jgi:hypothetical protein
MLCFPLFSQDWAGLHNTLIKYYSYQRSGLKSTAPNGGNPYNPFYTRAAPFPHANDYCDGGWYDAGDFVKFGLPMGYTVYCLLLGYDVFPGDYDDLDSWDHKGKADGIPDILNEAKVGTDYLIKAIVSPTQIVLDIGNAPADHGAITESGYDNSNRLNNRQVQIWADGADAPAWYSASLALMSKIYKSYDATYSATCLQKAKDAFTFCTNHKKACSYQGDPNNGGQPFYSSTTWYDKMACAAVELFRATSDSSYLTLAETYMQQTAQHFDVVSSEHGGDFAAFQLYRLGQKAYSMNWQADLGTAMNRVVGGNVLVTGASVNTTTWGICRTAANAAFSASLYYMVSGQKQYKDFALQQVKWVAGLSPYSKSYVVRYGTGAPQNPHHRNDVALGSITRLVGGIVSGPTSTSCTQSDKSLCTWTFTDSHDLYQNTEPALDYAAGCVGAVAFARYYYTATDTVRIENPIAATPDPIDFNVATSVTITASLDKSASWKVVLRGASSNATKSFSGTGTSISVSWTGDADSGSFMSQENVNMSLVIPKIWTPQIATMASGSFFLKAVKTQPFRSTDKLVDDFEKSTTTLNNEIGGKWIPFSDASDKVPGGASVNPAPLIDVGYATTKGLLFWLQRSSGATIDGAPYCGLKSTFNATGAAVNIGPVTSVVFDIYPYSDSSSIWVELEQSSITDNANYGYKLFFAKGSSWNRIRIPIANMAQPSWKTSTVALDLTKITSLRFVGYGVARDRFSLDNVMIENLSVATLPHRNDAAKQWKDIAMVRQSTAAVSFTLHKLNGRIDAKLFTSAGRMVADRRMNAPVSGVVTLDKLNLIPGVYFLKVSGGNGQASAAAVEMILE